jgi:RimJ/RimL family protein N-acetyltransferase
VIGFRRLEERDLPLMHRWLHQPHVAPWWFDEAYPTEEAVAQKYSPRLAEDTLSEQWVIEVDGEPAGWIQCYDVADWPETAADYHIDARGTAGVDLLLGDTDAIGRGLGPAVLRAFVDDVVFSRHPDWHAAVAAPHVGNQRSQRAFEKAGFEFVEDVMDEGRPGRLYRVERPV